MHTITECPKCHRDFMYHRMDEHILTRQMTLIDEVGNNEIIDVVICQDCHEIEKLEKVAKQYFDEKMSGEPLTEQSVIEGLVEFLRANNGFDSSF